MRVSSVPVAPPEDETCDMCGRRTFVQTERGIDVVMEYGRGRSKRKHSCPGYFAARVEVPRFFQGGSPGSGRR